MTSTASDPGVSVAGAAPGEDDFAREPTRESLLRPGRREIAAIHVPGFCDRRIAGEVAGKAVRHKALGNYHKKCTSTVGRVFMPHIDTAGNPDLTTRYHDAALPSINEVRALFAPCLSPVDHVRLLLQERRPSGANLLRLRGRPCFVGALRVFHPRTSVFPPHNDHFSSRMPHAVTPARDGHRVGMAVFIACKGPGEPLQYWS
ncbi:hypothetical protein [Streptomyces rimosus]|uniref:hypothetical protein n=1 Tax=Streptomyces rimosus TaxID=1927 RepID=UPI0004C600A8|nr:hypothetical protein [Streptomyces rimosus]